MNIVQETRFKEQEEQKKKANASNGINTQISVFFCNLLHHTLSFFVWSARRLNVVFSHEWLIDVCMCTFFLLQKKKQKKITSIYLMALWRQMAAIEYTYIPLKIEIQCSVDFHFDNIYIKWRHSFDIMTMKKSISLYKHILQPF